jgi:Hemocyanin, copper containing domain
MGVMGETVTAMRDPIFYRWHKMIDSLFQQFKSTLQPYTKEQVITILLLLKSIYLENVRGVETVPSSSDVTCNGRLIHASIFS